MISELGRPLVQGVEHEEEEGAGIHQMVPAFLDSDKHSEQAHIYTIISSSPEPI